MKQGVQKFGRFLSGMVMPNIGAFIAWGLITALFIPVGWIPNETLALLVDPMLDYLLPLLIAYTGGKAIGDVRGGVMGAIATTGAIVGSPETPMLLGAMIMGPVGGVTIKVFDKLVHNRVPAGFEMLVNNFSVGILGFGLAILAFVGIGPFVVICTNGLGAGVSWLVDNGLLPLSSILVEPAKVLFLNNAINHGVFTPLGAQDVLETGKSIFYMIESNPGPGMGLLLSYMVVGKGSARSSAPGAAIIHFFGGIHEIYFPFVLMNPILIVALIAGGATGVFLFSILGGGLVGPAAPGSIIAEMMMTAPDAYFANITGIVASIVVTFLIAALLLKKFGKGEDELEAAQARMKDMKSQAKGTAVPAEQPVSGNIASSPTSFPDKVTKIVFACDAGMGSSAMGATKLRKRIKDSGITGIEVVHAPVSEVPTDAQIIVTHEQLQERAQTASPGAYIVAITDFLNAPQYVKLMEDLKSLEDK